MVDLMSKDLRLVMEAADDIKSVLPATALVRQMFKSLQSDGEGRSGTQSLVKVAERLAGVEVGKNG
jgi:3-hydroxyisobutyrate dehydrogenase-like beta-hydroxyacid dehydrogenase